MLRRRARSRRVAGPLDWSLSRPARGLRNDLQELILFPLVRSFARIEVRGRRALERVEGPLVLVSNHTSHFDCPLILASLPHRIRHRTIVAAAADYFYKVQALGMLTSLALGTVPFERGGGSRESLDRLKEGLRRGWSVLIFPEGTRSPTGEMGRFKGGAAYLSIDTKTAALPIHISGARDIMPKGAFLPKPGRVRITFGQPVGPRPQESYDDFSQRLRGEVSSLPTMGG